MNASVHTQHIFMQREICRMLPACAAKNAAVFAATVSLAMAFNAIFGTVRFLTPCLTQSNQTRLIQRI